MLSTLRLISKLFRARRDPCQVLTLLSLKNALKGCDTVLDVGCGNNSPMSLLEFQRLVGIDAYVPGLEAARKAGTHSDYHLGDIRNLQEMFEQDQFDACIAVDVIEHLTQEEGIKLMQAMERIARKKVAFFTPNGFLPQARADEKDLQEHQSGWVPADVEPLGYEVKGLLGPKSLRGEHHILKYRPRFLWSLIALLGHLLWTRSHPNDAAAILFSKSVAEKSPAPPHGTRQ